ncbi:hypothetical protein HK405_009120, partial [Cladochytrium tenue]
MAPSNTTTTAIPPPPANGAAATAATAAAAPASPTAGLGDLSSTGSPKDAVRRERPATLCVHVTGTGIHDPYAA